MRDHMVTPERQARRPRFGGFMCRDFLPALVFLAAWNREDEAVNV